jgi:hypothetical protein
MLGQDLKAVLWRHVGNLDHGRVHAISDRATIGCWFTFTHGNTNEWHGRLLIARALPAHCRPGGIPRGLPRATHPDLLHVLQGYNAKILHALPRERRGPAHNG